MAEASRPRMSRFRRFLLAITAVCHLPFVVAVACFSHRRGGGLAPAVALGLAAGALGLFLFTGRVEKVANDRPRSFRETFFFDLPYYVHWSACVFCLVPSVVYLIVGPIASAVRGVSLAPSA